MPASSGRRVGARSTSKNQRFENLCRDDDKYIYTYGSIIGVKGMMVGIYIDR